MKNSWTLKLSRSHFNQVSPSPPKKTRRPFQTWWWRKNPSKNGKAHHPYTPPRRSWNLQRGSHIQAHRALFSSWRRLAVKKGPVEAEVGFCNFFVLGRVFKSDSDTTSSNACNPVTSWGWHFCILTLIRNIYVSCDHRFIRDSSGFWVTSFRVFPE